MVHTKLITVQVPLVNEISFNRARNNRSMTINSVSQIFSANAWFLLVSIVFFLFNVTSDASSLWSEISWEWTWGVRETAYKEFGSFPKSFHWLSWHFLKEFMTNEWFLSIFMMPLPFRYKTLKFSCQMIDEFACPCLPDCMLTFCCFLIFWLSEWINHDH